MGKPTKRPAARQTPKQRKAQAKSVRANARLLAMCNGLEFWQVCPTGACRRNHACRGDQNACFTRHWALVPDDIKAFMRARIDAQHDGLAPAAAVRAALETRERYLEWRDLIYRNNNAV